MMKMCLCVGQKLLWTTRGAHNPNLWVVIMHLSAAIGGGGGKEVCFSESKGAIFQKSSIEGLAVFFQKI